jgi:hypothetical protein
MKKQLVTAFFLAIVVCGLTFAGEIRFSLAQNGTTIFGIIYSDTTWTKANSPYSFAGPLSVFQGVTLTIEPGVIVNLNEYYIQVNGTLIARGTNNDKISFNNGSIFFTPISNGWNEQTGSGSIIQKALFTDSVSISDVSVKITEDYLNGLDINGGSSTVSYNSIRSIDVKDGSPTITNNDITGDFTVGKGTPTITSNTIDTRLIVKGGAPVISNNKIYDGIHADSRGSQVTITNNEISSKNNFTIIHVGGIHAEITNNKITGNNNPTGILVSGVLSSASITQNQIYWCQIGIDITQCNAQISRNGIFNNTLGINIRFYAPTPGATGPWAVNPSADIQKNTIAKNSIGIQYAPYVPTSTVTDNNIYDNSQHNFKLQYQNNITIPNNWWGTTDVQAINQTIFDFKYDFNLGTVTFTPFLTQLNTQAPTIPTSLPTPTQTPTTAPTQTTSPSTTPTQTTLTPTPTHPATSTPTSNTSPTQNPTSTPEPDDTKTAPLTELYVVIGVLVGVIVVMSIIIVALVFRKKH